MGHFIAFALVWSLLVALVAPAVADDAADCRSKDPDTAIAGCTKLVNGHKLDSRGTSAALTTRSRAYAQKGNLVAALSDATQAIATDPRNANAYYARAAVHNRNNESARALDDINKAIQINPSYANAYHARGFIVARSGDYERALTDYNRAIELDSKAANFYYDRASILARKDQLDRAVADCTKAISLDVTYAPAHYCLGSINLRKGEYDLAMADYRRAMAANPKYALAYVGLGSGYGFKGDYQRALSELTRAIEFDSKLTVAYSSRGRMFFETGDLDRAMQDAEKAIELEPKSGLGYKVRALVYMKRGQPDRALADLNRTIELEPRELEAYRLRAEILLARNDLSAADSDLRTILRLPARATRDRDAQTKAAQILTQISEKQAPAASSLPPVAVAPSASPTNSAVATSELGTRVALVIGNSAYAHAGTLKNPANDAKLIASAFRKVGFTDVIEKYDLGLASLSAALKEFGDRAASADWAVIYFAGHGLEVGGTAYLVPTDAKLERDSHVVDEAISLDRMLQKTEGAKKLRLIILDACRNNPFVTRMVRTVGATRAIGQGLPAIEVEGDVLVAYATKHGTTALDGNGDNSPFATALAQNLSAPNTDVRVIFGRVRDAVRKATSNQQEPYTYGSIGGDLHYFALAPR